MEKLITFLLESDQVNSNLVLMGHQIRSNSFIFLHRYILLSCGVFTDEVNEGMLALLNKEQLELLNSNICNVTQGGPLIVHGAAGTGKTLLALRKLEQLHQIGQLDENNRALFVCYWPGIR